ncbi:hypothetical protein HDE_13581 [Halotydeus destructor]|nr:hypothetical protein HDE_13581 [Halotydeus destructor]
MADRIRKLGCLKYFMMSSNAFGVMIGIFLVLFGLAYPTVKFPGGYHGKETSIIAGVFIFFTLIGYCGAHHQKIYFLVLYSIIILLFFSSQFALWLFDSEYVILDPESRTVYIVCCLFIILMVTGIILSWQIRRTDHPGQELSLSHLTSFTTASSKSVQQQQPMSQSQPLQQLQQQPAMMQVQQPQQQQQQQLQQIQQIQYQSNPMGTMSATMHPPSSSNLVQMVTTSRGHHHHHSVPPSNMGTYH